MKANFQGKGVTARGTNLGKLLQHLSHFISSLTTPHIDNNIRVGVLGERLGDDSLATTKGSRDGGGSTLDTSEGEIGTFTRERSGEVGNLHS